MKKKGVTLIEVVVTIAIMILIISTFVSGVIRTSKSFRLRVEEEELNRLIYCTMQEIKYNYTIDEVLEKFKDDYIELKNDRDFLVELQENSLFSLEGYGDLKIYLLNKDSNSIKFKISIGYKEREGFVEREFEKFKWMDDL